MADINRNEEKVPAPEEIHGLAAALDQFGADFDPYEYMDTVEDKEQNIRDTEAMLLAGKTDGLKNYLLGFIDDDRDPQAVQAAQELMKRLEEIIPQNALRTAEMSMEQNCNMIDGILNNLPNPEEVGLSIARRVNSTGNLYEEDIADLKTRYGELWGAFSSLLSKFEDL